MRPDALIAAALDRLTERRAPGDGTDVEVLGSIFDAGLGWVDFPLGEGGLGLAPPDQAVADRLLAEAGYPRPSLSRNLVGVGMAAPTLVAHGTVEQRRRYLRPIFTAEEIWCQLFSEPGAGSDLASVATTARRDGGRYLVNGQKVWTTLGHSAHYGMLLARTDPSAHRHRGLSFFVVDMATPGVDVRPLRQMTGDAEFNEVFLTDVEVPAECLLGDVGDGWAVAMTMLMHERVSIGGELPQRFEGPVGRAIDLYREAAAPDGIRDHLLRLVVDAEVTRLTLARAAAGRTAGTPGPEGSVAKLAFSEINQRATELCLDLLGAEGMLIDGYDAERPSVISYTDGPSQYLFLRARANTIEGGTSEVQRNILAERVLGLPREPKVDA